MERISSSKLLIGFNKRKISKRSSKPCSKPSRFSKLTTTSCEASTSKTMVDQLLLDHKTFTNRSRELTLWIIITTTIIEWFHNTNSKMLLSRAGRIWRPLPLTTPKRATVNTTTTHHRSMAACPQPQTADWLRRCCKLIATIKMWRMASLNLLIILNTRMCKRHSLWALLPWSKLERIVSSRLASAEQLDVMVEEYWASIPTTTASKLSARHPNMQALKEIRAIVFLWTSKLQVTQRIKRKTRRRKKMINRITT